MTRTSIKRVFTALSFLLLTAAFVRADEPSSGADRMQKMHEKRLEHLTKELSLSSDQQSQVKTILDDQEAKMKAVTSRGDRRAIHEASDQKIMAVLNDDQKAKFQKMQDERKQKMKDWKQNHPKKDSNQGQNTNTPQTN